MTYESVCSYNRVNCVNSAKVLKIKKNIIEKGWIGSPILVAKDQCFLVSGSHRMKALDLLYDCSETEHLVESAKFEDVSDIVEQFCLENDCSSDDLPYDNLRILFEGTHIEKYKEFLTEW